MLLLQNYYYVLKIGHIAFTVTVLIEYFNGKLKLLTLTITFRQLVACVRQNQIADAERNVWDGVLTNWDVLHVPINTQWNSRLCC